MTADDKILVLDCVTRFDIPVDRVIDGLSEADLESIVVAGFTNEGDFYFASNKADGGDVLWLLKIAEKKLLEIGDS